jgi:hypothetical protein
MAEADSGEGSGDGGGFAYAAAAGIGFEQGQPPAIPEKYQVKKEDGTVDIEASSLKLTEAYRHLEKRLGAGDMPPRSADEYQLNVPDAYKDVDLSSDSLLNQFKQDALAKGLTQDQFDFVMGKYFEIAPGLAAQSRQLSLEECTAALREEWKTDSQYNLEMRKAHMAAVAFGEKDAEGLMNDYGNDPRLVRLLNRVGAEMGEDRSINPGGTLPGGQSVESLMQSEAYTNPKHADHASVSARVQAYFNAQAEAASRAGAAGWLGR